MRTFIKITFIITLFSVMSACKKDKLDNTSLTGKWKQTERSYSIGGPMITEKVSGNQYVHFKADGKFESDQLPGYVSYKITDGGKVDLYKADGTVFTYAYSFNDNKLYMSPRTTMCIEGCSNGYTKIADQ